MNNWVINQLTGEWESIRRAIESDPIGKPYRPWSEVYWIEGYTLTKEQSDAMYDEVYKPIVEWGEQIQKNNEALMKEIKKEVSGSLYYGICRYLKDLKENSYYVDQMEYKIVDKPQGKYQKEKWSKDLQGLWVEQWSEGMEGDSWAGNVYIQIGKDRYLTVNYSM